MTDSTIHAGGQHLSGAALAARGVQVAAGLAAMGVREGDVIYLVWHQRKPIYNPLEAFVQALSRGSHPRLLRAWRVVVCCRVS